MSLAEGWRGWGVGVHVARCEELFTAPVLIIYIPHTLPSSHTHKNSKFLRRFSTRKKKRLIIRTRLLELEHKK